jgi:hypothetical protein
MLSTRLVQLIETHWEEIASRVIREIRNNAEMSNLAQQPDIELREWCREITANLGYLLSASKSEERRRRFEVYGQMRFEENIPLHEAVGRCHLLKDKIIGLVHEQGLPMTAMHLYAEEELELRVNRFFDGMVYYLVRGYEAARARAARWAS